MDWYRTQREGVARAGLVGFCVLQFVLAKSQG